MNWMVEGPRRGGRMLEGTHEDTKSRVLCRNENLSKKLEWKRGDEDRWELCVKKESEKN